MQVPEARSTLAWFPAAIAVSFLVFAGGCNKSTSTATPTVTKLSASGSTFVHPMMSKWANEYNKLKGVQVAYNAIGSGAGTKEMMDQIVDFGCSDGPMNDETLKKATEKHSAVLHIPLAMGAVVAIYNLEEVKSLHFNGEVLADIYLGKIKKWNDAKIQSSQEPGVKLPDKDIVVVHRSDGSGTTYIWTDFLSKTSDAWKTGPGRGTTIKFPEGVGQKGSEGVTALVKQTPGAIGYVEMTYALQNKVSFGTVQNKEGNFPEPSLASVTAAASASLKEIPDDLRYSVTDAPGKDAYPISGTVWALVYTDQPPGKGKAIYDFLTWVTHDGQKMCAALDYARLPDVLIPRIEKRLDEIKK